MKLFSYFQEITLNAWIHNLYVFLVTLFEINLFNFYSL